LKNRARKGGTAFMKLLRRTIMPRLLVALVLTMMVGMSAPDTVMAEKADKDIGILGIKKGQEVTANDVEDMLDGGSLSLDIATGEVTYEDYRGNEIEDIDAYRRALYELYDEVIGMPNADADGEVTVNALGGEDPMPRHSNGGVCALTNWCFGDNLPAPYASFKQHKSGYYAKDSDVMAAGYFNAELVDHTKNNAKETVRVSQKNSEAKKTRTDSYAEYVHIDMETNDSRFNIVQYVDQAKGTTGYFRTGPKTADQTLKVGSHYKLSNQDQLDKGLGCSKCGNYEFGYFLRIDWNKVKSAGKVKVTLSDAFLCGGTAYPVFYVEHKDGTTQAVKTNVTSYSNSNKKLEKEVSTFNSTDIVNLCIKGECCSNSLGITNFWGSERTTDDEERHATLTVELYPEGAPDDYDVICIDKIMNASGAELGRQTARSYAEGATARGSDWGTTSPYANYTLYKGDTSITVSSTNKVVYRYFSGQSTVKFDPNATGTTLVSGKAESKGEVGAVITETPATYKRTAEYGTKLWQQDSYSTKSGADNASGKTTSFTYPASTGGISTYYAIWKPSLEVKLTGDAKDAELTVNGGKIDSGYTQYNAYGDKVLIGATFNGTTHFKEVLINGVKQEGVTKLPIEVTMDDCKTVEIVGEMNAARIEKAVCKKGTDTDINNCIIRQGEEIDYVITLLNNGTLEREYTVEDPLDEGLDYVAGSADNGGSFLSDSRKVVWNFKLEGGQEKTVRFTAKANGSRVGQRVTNYARYTEKAITSLGETEDTRKDSNYVYNYVAKDPVKHLRQTAEAEYTLDDTILIPGQTGVYTITVHNPSYEDVDFDVTDVIPAGLIPKGASDGGTISGQTVTWKNLSISAREGEKTLSVEVEVSDESASGEIVNHANAVVKDANGAKLTSNKVENYIMSGPKKDVFLTLKEDGTTAPLTESVDGQVVNSGILLTYKISWKNPSATNRRILLKDVVPEGTRIATTADLDKASNGINLTNEYDYTGNGNYLISDGGTYDDASKTVTWTLNAAASGENGEHFVTFTVVPLKTSQDHIVENTANMTVVSPTGINENNPTMQSNLVRNPVLLTPHKTAKRDGQDVTELVVNDGETITYEITFKNPADTEKDFTVTDIIPEFTSYVDGSASDGGTLDASGLVTWHVTLAAGASKTVSFQVLVKEEGQNQTVRNTAKVYVDKAKAVTDEDVPVKVYVLEDPKKAVLNVDGEDINGVVKRAGEVITYHIIYKNPAEDERTATITDKLPDGLEFISAEIQGSYDTEKGEFVKASGDGSYKYDKDTNTIVWTVPTSAKCQEMVSVDCRILDSAKDTVLKNTASVYIPNATKQTNEVITPVVDNPKKKALDKSSQDLNGNFVTVGEEFTYSIRIKNPAEESKEGFVTDTLPLGVEFLSCTEGGAYDRTSHTVYWKNIPLKAKEEREMSIRVKVNEDAERITLVNDAVYRIDNASVSTQIEDGGEGGPKTYVTVKEVLNKKGEDIDKRLVASGSTLLYKISYKNVSDQEKFLTIVDEIPEGEEVVEIGDNGFLCKKPLEGFNGRPLSERTVGWQFYVPGGQEGYVTVTTKVTATKECVLENYATLRIAEQEKSGKAFLKDTNIVYNPVLPNPVKMVFNKDGREITNKMVRPGDELTYKIVWRNPADEAKEATVFDRLPKEVEFISAENGGVYDSSSHSVKWTGISSEPHKQTSVSFVVKVREDAGGKMISNQGTLALDEAIIHTRAKTPASDPNDPEPSERETTDNYVAYKRSLDKEGNDISGGIVKVGDTVMYCISYANTSSTEKVLHIKDVLPEEVDYVSATKEPVVDGRTLTWEIPIDGATAGHVDVTVTVNEKGYGKEILNTADITETDPNSVEDPYTITTKATNLHVFNKDDFVKSVADEAGTDVDQSMVPAGSKLYYKIKLHNPSKEKAEFTVTDALPNEVQYSSCTEGGTYDEKTHTVTWKLELEGDATAELEIAVKVKNSITDGEIRNHAHVVTKGTEMDSNEVVTYIFPAPEKKQYAGSKELESGAEVECSDEVTYKITFKNPADREVEVTVTDQVDANISGRVLNISDKGALKDGKITWKLTVPAKAEQTVSFTASAPEKAGVTVKNKAHVLFEDFNGKTKYDTNEVKFVTKKKGDDPKQDDPRKTPEIVKTGDTLLGNK
jgi:uncharacterized repeat protein (TIGR01451 family)